ncbi:unnamed protein product [Caenorhabditis sp. 36 PRJEB53466]|nr:unnamed protein product [Caenorhabditis sp. 36 PRJEB53466]
MLTTAPHEGTPLKKGLSSSSTHDDEIDEPASIDLHETGAPAIDGIVSELDETFRERSSIRLDSEPHPVDYITGVKFAFLLFTTALVNAQMNGIITSVQSYATLPYSQSTYHFAVTLSNVVSPLSSFLPFFISVRRIPLLGVLTACSTVMTAFIVYLASLSPNLIFDSQPVGSALSIGGSLVAAGLHSYLRVTAKYLRHLLSRILSPEDAQNDVATVVVGMRTSTKSKTVNIVFQHCMKRNDLNTCGWRPFGEVRKSPNR